MGWMWQETQYLSLEVYSDTLSSDHKNKEQTRIPNPTKRNFNLFPLNALLSFILNFNLFSQFLCFKEESGGRPHPKYLYFSFNIVQWHEDIQYPRACECLPNVKVVVVSSNPSNEFQK
jgi:hypothetical protein